MYNIQAKKCYFNGDKIRSRFESIYMEFLMRMNVEIEYEPPVNTHKWRPDLLMLDQWQCNQKDGILLVELKPWLTLNELLKDKNRLDNSHSEKPCLLLGNILMTHELQPKKSSKLFGLGLLRSVDGIWNLCYSNLVLDNETGNQKLEYQPINSLDITKENLKYFQVNSFMHKVWKGVKNDLQWQAE